MLTKHFFPDVHILPHSAVPNMMKAFNDETFELDKYVSDLGLQVFRQIEMRNGVYDELVSLLPLLPGVASNAADDFIEPFSIEPSSIELSSIERNVHRVDQFENVRLHRASSVHNHFRQASDQSSSNSKYLLNLLLPISRFLRRHLEYPCREKILMDTICCVFYSCVPIILRWSLHIMP